MATLSNPSEIAREALRQLALRRVAPTPDNYRKLYAEIAGTRIDDDTPSEAFLRKLARRLPRDMAERQRLGRESGPRGSTGPPCGALTPKPDIRPLSGTENIILMGVAASQQ